MTDARLSPDQQSDRYTALDGLRGLAAAIVVIAHTYFFLQPVIADPLEHALYGSYLSLFISGREAVAIFFVLSGLVITLPVLKRGKKFRWDSYYISRFLRLYLPTAASILFAVALILIVPRSIPLALRPTWLGSSTTTLFFPEVVGQLLFFPADGKFPVNNVLWSLRWEMYFSFLLPVFIGLTLVLKKFWSLLIVLCIAMLWLGFQNTAQSETAAQFFATFGLGTLIAVHREALTTVFAKAKARRWSRVLVSIMLLFLSVTCLIAYHFTPNDGSMLLVFIETLYPLGAAGIVLCALFIVPVKAFLNTSVMQFLGKISFSFYLVHVPIIVTYGYLFGFKHVFVAAACAVATSFLVAIIFYTLVEKPSHRFAKYAGIAVPKKMHAVYMDLKTNGLTLRKPPSA